ncbi:hypothetical protein [Dictyobacter kobayashii]|uniref:Uncharacterized protein n=1 Tax=Dictyobacter kobayashii TaxID=2014872 RepID=A0A402AIS9_9CHLR|nr:hypothetical protein [Dictyobacter kobayashii]GCE18960.1 hypothetical protein KDK_27600 [Dictyobacter kobayashii]
MLHIRELQLHGEHWFIHFDGPADDVKGLVAAWSALPDDRARWEPYAFAGRGAWRVGFDDLYDVRPRFDRWFIRSMHDAIVVAQRLKKQHMQVPACQLVFATIVLCMRPRKLNDTKSQ